MSDTKQHPLVIVFYLDREMMKQKEILQPFAGSINQMIIQKKLNAIAFFLPTDGEERVECINPVVVPTAEMEKIEKILTDIKTQFAVNETFDNIPTEDIEIELTNEDEKIENE
jgi:hypothetical protein